MDEAFTQPEEAPRLQFLLIMGDISHTSASLQQGPGHQGGLWRAPMTSS